MPKAGDRIVIEGTKLGQVRREGDVLEVIGSLLKVRWNDGSESLLTPGAGTVAVVGRSNGKTKPKRGAGAKKTSSKTPAKKRAPSAKKKSAAKAKKKG